MQMMSKHTINHLLRAIHIIIWVKREKIESQFSLAFSWPSVRWPQLRFYRRKNGRVWIWCTISDKPGKQTNHNALEMRNFRVRFVLTSVLARLHLLTVVSLHLSSQRSKMVLPSVDFTARFVFTNPKICKKLDWRRLQQSTASLPTLCWKLWMVNTAQNSRGSCINRLPLVNPPSLLWLISETMYKKFVTPAPAMKALRTLLTWGSSAKTITIFANVVTKHGLWGQLNARLTPSSPVL